MSELLPILIAYSVIVTIWAVSERIGRKWLEVIIDNGSDVYVMEKSNNDNRMVWPVFFPLDDSGFSPPNSDKARLIYIDE